MNNRIPDTKVKVETLIKGFSLENEDDRNKDIIEFLNECRNKGITKVNPFILNNIWVYYVKNLVD